MSLQNKNCSCEFNTKNFGVCDVSKITLNGADRRELNWNEISIPEVLEVPIQKPSIEHLDQVFAEAKINCVKLIETPFAYDVYERLATPFEIDTVTDALNLANIDLTPVINAVNAILAIPGLPLIPAVAALQAALAAVVAAGASLADAVADALIALVGPCVVASLLITVIETVLAALAVLRLALDALLAAAEALVTATAGIPIVGVAVAAAVDLLLTAVNAVFTLITAAADALLASITFIGTTSVLVLKTNEEGTCLSGRKLIIEGELKQKVVYTALVPSQSVHSVHKSVPFNAYIIPYASFTGLTFARDIIVVDPESTTCETITVDGFLFDPNVPLQVNLCEEFHVNACIEDIFSYAVDERTIFKNITLFLSAKPAGACS